MSYQRSQTPTTAPQQAPFASSQAPTFSPLLSLQGLIGNAGVLDLLRPQMPGAPCGAGPSSLTSALQSVLQQDATAPTPPPGGTEAPSTTVAATLADEGQTAALTRAPSSPATSAAAQVTALDETQGGVEGAITDSPALTTAVAAELGTTPSDVTAQAQDAWQPSWWDEAVDATVGGVGGLVDGGVDLLSDVPVLGTAAATMAPVTKFAWETLGGFAKGAGDLVGGLGHMVAHPLDTLTGLATMAEHIPFSPLKPLHKLYDVATTDKTLKETFWRNPLDVAKEDLSADWDFWKGVGGALLDPYERSVEQGKYGEALGRGIFDIGGLFVGASEAKAASKGAEVVNVLEHASVLNKVDDSVKIAGRANELGAVTDDLVRAGGKADDATKVGTWTDDASDLTKIEDNPPLPATQEPAPRSAASEAHRSPHDRADAGDAVGSAETQTVDELTDAGREPLRELAPEALDARIEALQSHPLLGGDLDQLQKVIHDAKLGQSGALGELQAIERWLAEGKPVEVLTEIQNAGIKNPDYRVGEKLTEVKTRVEPLSKSYIKDEINKANKQIKRSGTGEVGQVEIQLEKEAAGADLATVEAQVRSQFHNGTSHSLDRVAVYSEGELLGEWVRGADGSVSRTYPAAMGGAQ